MEKKFNLKVSARITPSPKSSVEALSFNQLLLRSNGSEEPKKFQLDKMSASSYSDICPPIKTKSCLRTF